MKQKTILTLLLIFTLASFVSAQNCTDTDGGLNYYVKGDLSLNGNYIDSDWCSGSNLLNEKYCISNSSSGTKSYTCQWGCYDGACFDSDPWENYIYQANYLSFDFSSFTNTTQTGSDYQEYQAHYDSDSYSEEVSVLVFSSTQDANDFFDNFASNIDLVFEKEVGRFLDSNREATVWVSDNKFISVVGSSSESIENLYLEKYPSTTIINYWENYIYQANYLSFDFSSFTNTTQTGSDYQEYQAHYDSDSYSEEVSVLVFSSTQDANDFFDNFASNVDLVFEKGTGRFLDSNREATVWVSNNKFISVVGSSSDSIENLYLEKYPSTIKSSFFKKECEEDWDCGSWSNCDDGKKTRTCEDLNDCGTTEDKPSTTKSCDEDDDSDDNSTNLVNYSNETENSCNGCLVGEVCFELGYIKDGKYCFYENKTFVEQKKPESICENNFECDSNLCINNECVSGSLWAKFIRWLSRIFG